MRYLAGSLLSGIFLCVYPLSAQNVFLTAALKSDFFNTDLFEHTGDSDSSFSSFDWEFIDWDRDHFNPYREQDLKTPFYLSFDDEEYAAPVGSKVVVTSRYGWRNGHLHRGIDLALVTGADVFAILDGKVRYVRSHAGHGKTVIIRHENGLETIYAHLSKQLVEENQMVKKGQVIGKGGKTGNARGSHLHLEVRYEGVTINPEYFFDFSDNSQIKARFSWITEHVTNPRLFSSTKKISMVVSQELTAVKDEPKKEVKPEIKLVKSELLPVDPVPSDPPVSQKDFYEIQYGDTLYSLARKHNLTVEDICRINGIRDSFKIKVGQKIILHF